MKHTFGTRLAAVVGVVSLAAGGVLLSAPAAEATAGDCVGFLAGHGHGSAGIDRACRVGSTGSSLDHYLCVTMLAGEPGVGGLADPACTLAGM